MGKSGDIFIYVGFIVVSETAYKSFNGHKNKYLRRGYLETTRQRIIMFLLSVELFDTTSRIIVCSIAPLRTSNNRSIAEGYTISVCPLIKRN